MEKYKNYTFLIEGVVICVTMVSYRQFSQVLPTHCHGKNVYEFHYVSRGYGTISLNSKKYNVKPGILYVTGPGIFHEQIPDTSNPMTEFGLYMHIQDNPAGGEIIKELRSHPCWIGKGTKEFEYLMNQILFEQEEKKVGYTEKIPLLLTEFLIECVRSYGTSKINRQTIPVPKTNFETHSIQEENALLVVDEIFLYEYNHITLDLLSKRLGFSIRQTQRLLKKIYGKSFTEKKLEARMSAAITMLQNSGMKITAISDHLGYSSIEHFSNTFSRFHGMSPTQYRKQKSTYSHYNNKSYSHINNKKHLTERQN